MYYSVFGTIVTLFVGVLASWFVKGTDQNQYSLKLLHPIVRKFIKSTESYASNDILSNNAPQITRKSTVYTIYNAKEELTKPNEAKYTQNIEV